MAVDDLIITWLTSRSYLHIYTHGSQPLSSRHFFSPYGVIWGSPFLHDIFNETIGQARIDIPAGLLVVVTEYRRRTVVDLSFLVKGQGPLGRLADRHLVNVPPTANGRLD